MNSSETEINRGPKYFPKLQIKYVGNILTVLNIIQYINSEI